MPFHELIAHGLAGEVEGSLADGGVAVFILRTQGAVEEPLQKIVSSGFQASRVEDELVILGSQVRMVRVDEVFQVGRVLGLEGLQVHLFIDHLGRVFRQLFGDLGVPEDADIFQALYMTLPEKIAAVDDLVNGLIEGNGLPLVFAPLPGPL